MEGKEEHNLATSEMDARTKEGTSKKNILTSFSHPTSTSIVALLHNKEINHSPIHNKVLELLFKNRKTYYHKTLTGHTNCVNTLKFSHNNELLASAGDDGNVFIWSMSQIMGTARAPPVYKSMSHRHDLNIFSVIFNACDKMVLSGDRAGDIYAHQLDCEMLVWKFQGSGAVHQIDADPYNDCVFIAAADEAHGIVLDLRAPAPCMTFAHSAGGLRAVQYNPASPQYLATVNATDSPLLWDIRNLHRPVIKYKYFEGESFNGMSLAFDKHGAKLLAIGRWVYPIIYDVARPEPLQTFNDKEYTCACTLKSCCWLGPDHQYIATGSDDFGVHLWDVRQDPDIDNAVIDKASRVLRGHRSIVTQVQYNDDYAVIASSGIEKVIKLWSPLPSLSPGGGPPRQPKDRFIFLRADLSCLEPPRNEQLSTSTQESEGMLYYFDHVVQLELKVHPSISCFDCLNSTTSSDDESKTEVTQISRDRGQLTMRQIIRFVKKRDEKDWKTKTRKKMSEITCDCLNSSTHRKSAGSTPCLYCHSDGRLKRWEESSSEEMLDADESYNQQPYKTRPKAVTVSKQRLESAVEFGERVVTEGATAATGETSAFTRRNKKTPRRHIRKRENSDSDS